MADRNLTFEDFKRLSPEERNRRYEKLSDHDKFLARCSQPSGVHGVLQYLYPPKAGMLQGVSGWYPGRAYE